MLVGPYGENQALNREDFSAKVLHGNSIGGEGFPEEKDRQGFRISLFLKNQIDGFLKDA